MDKQVLVKIQSDTYAMRSGSVYRRDDGDGGLRHIIPEHALLVAVLCRAIVDASGLAKSDLTKGSKQACARDADSWMRASHFLQRKPFSMHWICNQLDLDPAHILQVVEYFRHRPYKARRQGPTVPRVNTIVRYLLQAEEF